MGKKQCTYCNNFFDGKVRYCPFCGAENKKEIVNNIPICPRCKYAMEKYSHRNTDLDICPGCKGIWLDTSNFKKLTSERDVYADDSIPYEYIRKPLLQEKGYFPCPRCNSLMMRKNFRHISGVLIDICGYHGVWLDAGELEQIRCFVANGGLDESQDKDIIRNREEIKSIARSVKDLELMQNILHKWDVKRWMLRGF
ncbi:MAG: zf-TFIIB domain-containing protein [Candidatus Scalinduaceae bacterium]